MRHVVNVEDIVSDEIRCRFSGRQVTVFEFEVKTLVIWKVIVDQWCAIFAPLLRRRRPVAVPAISGAASG